MAHFSDGHFFSWLPFAGLASARDPWRSRAIRRGARL